MKFTVLAPDYDGTIARDGQLDPDVRTAIDEVRARGIVVVPITGRILKDLRRETGKPLVYKSRSGVIGVTA